VARKYDLRGRKVIVFGGAGFVGSQLVRNLLKHGSEVIVYDNFLHGHKDNLEEIKNEIEIVTGDVLDPWRLSWALKEFRPEFGFTSVSETYIPTTYNALQRTLDINIQGTVNILMTAKLFNLQRIVYLGTTEVYGNARTAKVDENHQLDPFNSYASTKLAADRLCFTLHKEHGIPVVIARFYNAYGPRESEPYVIPDIISQVIKKDHVELGNINARRDFTYVEDQAEALIMLMESSVPDGEAVNLGSGITYSVKELAEKVAKIVGKPADIRVDPRRFRRYDVDVFCADNSKLKKYTGWEPKVGIEEGLRLTVDWYMSHGKKWSWEDWIEGAVEGGDARRI
jgi:nucleoside-diphosphate-sugar epimerase